MGQEKLAADHAADPQRFNQIKDLAE